jgi:hypothetical protein
MDPHYFGKLDLGPDPHWNEKLDPDPHLSPNLGAVEAQNGAVDLQNEGVEAQNRTVKGLSTSSRILSL